MRTLLLVMLLAAPVAAGAQPPPCKPTQADPATVRTVDLRPIGGALHYFEERGLPADIAVPGLGFALSFFLGSDSYWYEEANGLPGLQRGMTEREQCIPDDLACLMVSEDHSSDETCGRGPDRFVLSPGF